jgi:hypothetical protein
MLLRSLLGSNSHFKRLSAKDCQEPAEFVSGIGVEDHKIALPADAPHQRRELV